MTELTDDERRAATDRLLTLIIELGRAETEAEAWLAVEVRRQREVLDKVRALSAPATEPLRDSAYYYSFDLTGVGIIDRILSAVAAAGKAYHHTEEWAESGQAAQIEKAAHEAAAAIRALGES